MMPVAESKHVPSAALTATTVEQIQGIVKICNEYKILLWTVSTGRNFGYGTAPPYDRGQIILDLNKMNKIIELDPVLCTALVEPGVTYQQLVDYIKEKGYKLWVDPPAPLAIVGPVGNTLDRGVGYTPYSEHFMFACGMEVVLANGEVFAGTALWCAAPTTLRRRARSSSERIRDEHQIGAWTAYGALYGTREQVDVNWKIVNNTVKVAGKGTIVTEEEAGDDIAFTYRADLMRGKMTLVEFGLYNWRGGGGSMWFGLVSQAKGSETRKQVELAT
jgi:hypothetical protein